MPPRLRCRRRSLLGGAALGALVSCGDQAGPAGPTVSPRPDAGRLSFRPAAPSPSRGARTGTYRVEVDGGRAAVVHAPDVSGPLRLVVMLHGAGGEPGRTLEILRPYAESHRLLIVAPASRRPTWDVILGAFGPDVRTVDTLLRRLTDDHAVDGLTVGGFSDGASYALTLGRVNGDVFDSVIAFSPGFEVAPAVHGRPRFYVSHGTRDQVLPIDACSRRIVPELRRQGYDVTYEEFDGPHEVPAEVRSSAVDWLTGSG